MRVAVVGTGAVGGYFGGRLAEAGSDVTFVARGAQLAALRADGLHVASIAGDFNVRPAQVTDRTETVGAVDAVLVAVKAWQIREVAPSIRHLLGADTIVIPLENGIDAPEHLVEVLGRKHVGGGLCRVLAFVDAPGRIRHVAIDPYIAFGELDNAPSERTDALQRAFARARGVTAEIPDDIHLAMWQKFLLIEAWSALGAVTRAPIGVVRSVPETRHLLELTLNELVAVAAAEGVSLPTDSARSVLTMVDAMPADGTTSMQRDLVQGRPSELEAQVGAVVRLATRSGVDIPAHRTLYAALLPQERTIRDSASV